MREQWKDDIGTYLDTKGSFTDFEKAGLIYRSPFRYPIKMKLLQKFCKTTEDEKLRYQIMERLKYEREAVKEFTEKRDGYVYAVKLHLFKYMWDYGEDQEIIGYHEDPYSAYQQGKNRQEIFCIEKYRILKGKGVDEENSGKPQSTAYFDEHGVLYSFESEEPPCFGEMSPGFKYNPGRFEDTYISDINKVKNPFLKGDTAMLITEEGACMIEETPAEWKIRNWGKGRLSNTDGYDFGVKVYIIYKGGEFENKSVSPAWLIPQSDL